MSQQEPKEFVPPPGAIPYVPPQEIPVGGVEPKTSEPHQDPSHLVQGMDTAPPLFDVPAEKIGPEIGEEVRVEEPEEKTTNAETTIQAPAPRLCPNCGWDTAAREGPAEPTDTDKRNWVSHVLGEPRFRKTYDLMGGQVRVTFRNRTQQEDDAIFAQLDTDVKSGSLPSTQPVFLNVEYGHRMHVYFMAFSIESVTSQSGKVAIHLDSPKFGDSETVVPDALVKLKSEVSQGLYLNLIEMQRKFESVTRTLVSRGSDPNFWEPTDG